MSDTPITDAISTSPLVNPHERFHTWGAAHKIDIETVDAMWAMQRSGTVLPTPLTETPERQVIVDQYAAAMWETMQQAKAAAKPEPSVTAPMIEMVELQELAFTEKGHVRPMEHRRTLIAYYQNTLGMNNHDAVAKFEADAEEYGVILKGPGSVGSDRKPTFGKTPRRVELLRAAQLRDFTGQGTEKPDTTKTAKPGTADTGSGQGGDDGSKNPWAPEGIDKRLGRYSDAAIRRQADYVRLVGVAKANATAAKFGRKVGDMK